MLLQHVFLEQLPHSSQYCRPWFIFKRGHIVWTEDVKEQTPVGRTVSKPLTFITANRGNGAALQVLFPLGTHFQRRPSTGWGCRGREASGGRSTDKWLCSCGNRAGSEAAVVARWGLEADGRSGPQKLNNTNNNILIPLLFWHWEVWLRGPPF